eukprot:CAMPEP_0115560696 /NCGR_PEP_ID=MMETSP0271-20121206/100603_1 /TAXON_ID=71861 /ORGANISM="Scrippsiella trochoidea, Strain CCMP3099" /LENGTH=39 /DNA_ID= /DNA_START= /DNA_END= /DNA_ORIENTATION=
MKQSPKHAVIRVQMQSGYNDLHANVHIFLSTWAAEPSQL